MTRMCVMLYLNTGDITSESPPGSITSLGGDFYIDETVKFLKKDLKISRVQPMYMKESGIGSDNIIRGQNERE